MQIECKRHGTVKSVTTIKKLQVCIKCAASSLCPLSSICPVHYISLNKTHANTIYCDDCAKHYRLCEERYYNASCIKVKNHDGPHQSPYALEWNNDDDIKMEFTGPFRRAKQE